MSEAEVAWLAGLFDGEGSIIQRHRRTPNDRAFEITITNGCKALIDKVAEITGVGQISLSERSKVNPRHADIWIWHCYGTDVALELLARMRPWLLARAERADAVLAGEPFPRQERWDHIYPPAIT